MINFIGKAQDSRKTMIRSDQNNVDWNFAYLPNWKFVTFLTIFDFTWLIGISGGWNFANRPTCWLLFPRTVVGPSLAVFQISACFSLWFGIAAFLLVLRHEKYEYFWTMWSPCQEFCHYPIIHYHFYFPYPIKLYFG